MNDKDWLDKVYKAYEVYTETYPDQKYLTPFINWLYKQYGVLLPKERE